MTSSPPPVQSLSVKGNFSEKFIIPSPRPVSSQSDSPPTPPNSSCILFFSDTLRPPSCLPQSSNPRCRGAIQCTPQVKSPSLSPSSYSPASAAAIGLVTTTNSLTPSSFTLSMRTSSSYPATTVNVGNTSRRPAFNSSSFQLSDMCHQQQHQSHISQTPRLPPVQPFHPFYSPPPSSGPFQYGFSSSTPSYPSFGYCQPPQQQHIQYGQLIYQNSRVTNSVVHQHQWHSHHYNTQHVSRQPLSPPHSSLLGLEASDLLVPSTIMPIFKQVPGGYPPPRSRPPAVDLLGASPPRDLLLQPTGAPSRARVHQQFHSSFERSGKTQFKDSSKAAKSEPTVSKATRLEAAVLKDSRSEPLVAKAKELVPTVSQSVGHSSYQDSDDDSVIFVSASTTSSSVTSPPSTLVRPIPVRILPPPSVFSWSRPDISSPLPLATSLPRACTNEERLVAVNRCDHIPSGTSQQHQWQQHQWQQHADQVVGGGAGNAKQCCHIIITEGDIDVGEQVTVETDKLKTSCNTSDGKLKEYKDFVTSFRSFRLSHNYTLLDVIQNVHSRFRKKLTLRSMIEFEDMVIEERKCFSIIAVLKTWMEDVAKEKVASSVVGQAQFHSIVPLHYKRRKTRTSSKVIWGLEAFFARKRTPKPAEYKKMAKEWEVEESFIRCWFSDRRKKENNEPDSSNDMLEKTGTSMLQKGVEIPSESHNISVEVPGWVSGGTCFHSASPHNVFV